MSRATSPRVPGPPMWVRMMAAPGRAVIGHMETIR